MAGHTGNWYPVGPTKWDASGNPYRDTSDGQKDYIPPIAAAQEQNDPRLLAWAKAHGANVTYGAADANGTPTVSDVRTGAPQGGFAGNYHWNVDTGGYEKDNFFDSSLGGLVLGASAVAAPFAASALAGPAASPATSIPAAFGDTAVDTLASAAPATAAGGGSAALLPSTQIGNGMIAAAPSSTSSLAAPAAAGLPDWLKTAQNVGDALSSASAGRAQGRLLEGTANQAQNRAAVDLYNTELNAPSTIARNAVKGDVLANAQDVHINTPSTIPDFNISGGLRPSMFSDATRQTGRNISAAAARTPIPSPTAPVLPDLPQAGGLDSFLNTASTISGLSRAVPPSAWGKIAGLFA